MFNYIYNHSSVFLQNCLVSLFGLSWKLRRYGGVFKKELLNAVLREGFSEEEWQNYQNRKLRKLLIHAFENVPYYSKQFSKCNLGLNELSHMDLNNLKLLPILSKQDLRKLGKSELLDKKLFFFQKSFYSSSGSTGTPVNVLLRKRMHQTWNAMYEARVRKWANVHRDFSRAMIGGRRVLPKAKAIKPFYRINIFENQYYFSAYHICKENTADYLEGINKKSIKYIVGYAASIYFLALFIEEAKLKVKKLEAVLTSSEKLTTEMRMTIQRVFHCKVYDAWSGIEACGLISECEHGKLHISPDAGIIEVLDENLNPVPFNQIGKVYCTGLLNYDQPLIRYEIGDEIILSDEKCTCNRNMPIVKEIFGRVEDVVYSKDGRKMVRFHSIFNDLASIKKAQVIQESFEKIIVKVIPVNIKASEYDINLINKRLISQLDEVTIEIIEVSDIALTSNGKFKAVISNLAV